MANLNKTQHIGFSITAAFCFLSLHTVDPPIVTARPEGVKDAIPGQPVTFTIQATGTKPLSYQWEQKPSSGSDKWQCCDMERLLGADSSTLTIPTAQKSDEGSYCCTVRNCAGSETSDPAALTLCKYTHCKKQICCFNSYRFPVPKIWEYHCPLTNYISMCSDSTQVG